TQFPASNKVGNTRYQDSFAVELLSTYTSPHPSGPAVHLVLMNLVLPVLFLISETQFRPCSLDSVASLQPDYREKGYEMPSPGYGTDNAVMTSEKLSLPTLGR
ncbi:hypothetical protein STEG23_013632, partial [Scotinomys teguina]